MVQVVNRNLKLYFRDRIAVFFSLLSVIIVIALYALFLSNTIKGNASFAEMRNVDIILDTWILAGLLSIVSLTTTLASFGVMVNGRSTNIMKDFYASSIKRWKLVVAYILAACIIGLFMSVCILVIFEIYSIANGGTFMGFSILLKVMGLSICSVMCGSSMMFLLTNFLKTVCAFSNASTITGTLSGFIMAICMPLGVMPEFAQGIVKLFPLSYGTASFRQVLLQDLLNTTFEGAPTQVISSFNRQMGNVRDTAISMNMNILIMLISTVVCILLSILVFRMKKK